MEWRHGHKGISKMLLLFAQFDLMNSDRSILSVSLSQPCHP